MLIKSSSEEEKKKIQKFVASDEELRQQHESFMDEVKFKQKRIDIAEE